MNNEKHNIWGWIWFFAFVLVFSLWRREVGLRSEAAFTYDECVTTIENDVKVMGEELANAYSYFENGDWAEGMSILDKYQNVDPLYTCN